MKKCLTRILALLMCLALLPCAAFAGDKVTLTVWEDEKTRAYFDVAIAEFEKLHPGIDVQFEAVGLTDSSAKLDLDGPAGMAADVFGCAQDHLAALVTAGHVLANPNPSYIQENFVEGAVVAGTYDGVLYGYPTQLETAILLYNKDILPEPPRTFEEIVEFAKTYNNPAENRYALVWNVCNGYFTYLFLGAYGADLFGPSGTDKSAHNINTPEAISSLTYFQSLSERLLPVRSGDLTDEFVNSAFANGNAAMIITGPWMFQTFDAVEGLNYSATTVPLLPDSTSVPRTFAGFPGMYVSAWTEHPEEAHLLAEFLVSSEMLSLRYEMLSQIPPRTDIVIENEKVAGTMEQAKYAKCMPSIPAMGVYWSSVNSAYGNIWNGSDVATELNAAAAAFDAAE